MGTKSFKTRHLSWTTDFIDSQTYNMCYTIRIINLYSDTNEWYFNLEKQSMTEIAPWNLNSLFENETS